MPGTESGSPPVIPPVVVKSAIHDWIDTASKLFQIVALIIAGSWAWIGFKQSVAPTLEAKLGIDSELHWAPVPGTDVCQASFRVKINNSGKTPFEVDHVEVDGRIIDLDQNNMLPANVDAPLAVDPDSVNKLPAFYSGTGGPISGDLSGHYAEGSENTGSFDVYFKYRQKRVVLFIANVYYNRPSSYWPFFSKPVSDTGYAYQIDQLCGANWDNHEFPRMNQMATPAKH